MEMLGTPVMPSVELLAAENASLRLKLEQSAQQRILEDVVQNQVKQFLKDTQNQVSQISSSLTDNEAEHESAVSQLLSKVCEEKASVENTLKLMYGETISPLRERVAELERERDTLQARVTELEMLSAGESPPQLITELTQTQKSEALLRSQLQHAQGQSLATTAKLASLLEESAAMSKAVPEYIQLVESLKGVLRDTQAAQRSLQVEFDEQRARGQILHNLHDAFASRERELQAEKIALLKSQLEAAQQRENNIISDKSIVEQQLVAAREAIKHHADSMPEETSEVAAKRRRTEAEPGDGSDPSSIRSEMIRFWYDGRDAIKKLQQRVDELVGKEDMLRVSQGRVAQLERSRAAMTSQLVAVASEVDKVRDDNQKLRAHCAGLEVERDHLVASVAMTVQEDMSAEELKHCCKTIRDAASRQAAASATVVADPAALQQAKLHAQQLKNEVAQLQRQKEKLIRFVELLEGRSNATLERDALLTIEKSGGKELPVQQLLDRVHQCAKDIFIENEVLSMGVLGAGDGASPPQHNLVRHRQSYLALQRELIDTKEQLAAAQEKLQDVTHACRSAQDELTQTRTTLGGTIQARESALAAAEQTNAALMSRTAVLGGQLSQLEKQYNDLSVFSQQVTAAISTVQHLLRAEMQHVDSLRSLVEEERADMVSLVRRESAHLQPASAVQLLVDEIQKLRELMGQAISQEKLDIDVQQTAYITRVVGILKDQEQRVTELQRSFADASQHQAAQLADRIVGAQTQWECAWRSQYEQVEAERSQLMKRQAAQQNLYGMLERVAAPSSVMAADVPTTTGAPPASDAVLGAIHAFIQLAKEKGSEQIPQAPMGDGAAPDDVVEASPAEVAEPETQAPN